MIAIGAGACDETEPLTRLEISGVFEPDLLDFGDVPVRRPTTLTAELRNTGSASLSIDDIAIPQGFAIVGAKGQLLGFRIPANGSLSLDITFLAQQEGLREGELVVTSGPVDIVLGLRANPMFRDFTDIRVDPPRIDFGTAGIADVIPAQVTLTNAGNLNAVVEVESENNGPFQILNELPLVVAAGGILPVNLQFTPDVVGRFEDRLVFQAADSSARLDLQGNAIQPVGDVLCDATINFGALERGRSARLTADCTARGGPARVVRVSLVAPDEDFSLPNAISTVDLVDGESISFFVDFQATGLPGDRAGMVLVDYTGLDGSAQTEIPLAGRVVAPPPTENELSIVLRWDTNNTDVDLHLVRPGGRFFDLESDCHYRTRNPDWGIVGETTDNPFLDVDNRDGFGPETINLADAFAGRYQVWVHFYAGPIGQSTRASVDIFLGGVQVGTYSQPLQCRRAWQVGVVDWNGETGTFLPDTLQVTTPEGFCRN